MSVVDCVLIDDNVGEIVLCLHCDEIRVELASFFYEKYSLFTEIP